MKILEVYKAARNPFHCVYRVDLYVKLVVLHFMTEHPDIGNSER
jgi:hypothetical protein